MQSKIIRKKDESAMSSIIKFVIVTNMVVVFAGLVAACSSTREVTEDSSLNSRGYAAGARIVSTDWVSENLGKENVKIVDIRKPEDYQVGHVPGAVNYPYKELQVEAGGVKGMLPPAENIASKLSSLGISTGDTVVIYDHIKNLWSTRLLWTLSVYGHEDANLMDGAWELWKAESKTVSSESPIVEASSYTFSAAKNESLIISMDSVVSSLTDSSSVVLDTRSAEEYAGRDVRAERGGHIPSSVHVEWVQNVDADGRFLPAADLKNLYRAANISDDLDIYTLCQTAVRATHSWFVLGDLLGYENVSVYDGSWTEWGNNEDTPIDS